MVAEQGSGKPLGHWNRRSIWGLWNPNSLLGLVINNCERHSVPRMLCQKDLSAQWRWSDQRILQTIAQSTLATPSAAEAVKKAVEDKKSSTTDWSNPTAKPNIIDYK